MKYTWESADTCVHARELVSLELDGERSEFEQAQLAAHIDSCPDCLRFQDELTAFTRQLRAAPAELPSEPIDVEAFRSRRRYLGAVAAGVAGAAVVMVGLGGVFGPLHAIEQRHRSQEPSGTLVFRDQRQQQQFARSQQLRTEEQPSVAANPRAPL
jgi:hypothetical protein